MFVEKLSLFGFKSFNKKISLTFDSGISSIIGPNGCGKSNVVDAMRWVLGEQSTKTLRGAKMEDVIFNGTRDEKPLSLAEVELTLNNDRGKLAIDYSTVTVARRLYRSGISEYLINKKPVRLKDVRELFMDTGMGSHAYSVIERQMVDNILSDTTGHRRFLFEEAAGIMKYKSRKKEALSKLEATERDLVRVDDIITEVERHVGTLKRQVGKARRYRELMEQIRTLDLAHSQSRRNAWLKELAALQTHYDQVLRVAESGETEVSNLDARLQELQLAVMREERALGEARELLAQVDDDIGRANSRILVLRERLEATRKRIDEAEEYKVRITDRKERNAAAQTEVAAHIADLEVREATDREDLEQGERELEQAEGKVRDLRATVTDGQKTSARLRDEHIRAESEFVSAVRRVEELQVRIEERKKQQGLAEEAALEHGRALEVSRDNVGRAAANVEEIEESTRVLAMRRDNYAARRELHRKKMAESREKEAAVRSRLSTLEDLKASYEGYDPGVRALLAENRDRGVIGTVGDLVQLPGEWKTALEPAMSAIWQHVVVADTSTARHLVQRLREESLGYATLIPLDRVPESPPPSGEGTWASEVVETDAAYRNLLRYLLKGLALVKDLDAALAIVREKKAPRAATRTGKFVDEAVIAGGEGGPQGSELVEREEAVARCRTAVEAMVRTIAELSDHEQELVDEEETLDREAKELSDRLADAVKNRTRLEREEAGLVLEQSHASERAAALREETEQLSAERDALSREQAALDAGREETRVASNEAAEALIALEEDLARAETEREDVLSRVHEMRIRWARLEGELRDAKATEKRLADELNDLTSEWERTIREQEEGRRQIGETERELEELANKVQEYHVLRDERAMVVGDREREKSEATAREQQDSESLRDVRRRATKARQESHETELKLSEIKGNLHHLEERLREEYDIDPAELDHVDMGELPEDAPAVLLDMKERIRRLGPVNLLAVEEYEEKSQRLEFMTTQRDDLVQAKKSLVETIEEINKTASGMFLETFAAVQENFEKTFKVLFQGGECSLDLTGDDPLEADIEVMARPRGKKPQSIQQLSSGERALTAIALLFAIYLVKPSPFCILDEVDAPLDDANIDRFVRMVKEFSRRTQFIVITHNKKTMEVADCLYGITMQRPGVSSVVSVKLDGVRTNGDGPNGDNGSKEDGPLSPESLIAQ